MAEGFHQEGHHALPAGPLQASCHRASDAVGSSGGAQLSGRDATARTRVALAGPEGRRVTMLSEPREWSILVEVVVATDEPVDQWAGDVLEILDDYAPVLS